MGAHGADDRSGIGVDAPWLQQYEVAKIQLPHYTRSCQQPHHGTQLVQGELLSSQTHIELLLQLYHAQQDFAFVLQLHDSVFEHLEDAGR